MYYIYLITTPHACKVFTPQVLRSTFIVYKITFIILLLFLVCMFFLGKEVRFQFDELLEANRTIPSNTNLNLLLEYV